MLMTPFWALILISVHGSSLAVVPGFHSYDACHAISVMMERKFHHVTNTDGVIRDEGATLIAECVEVD
jgi:hypothetical protein